MPPIPKILVVDDEPGIRFSLDETLTRDGYRVVAVESGEDALERIGAEEFDLALIDLKLTGIGGMEVVAALRDQSPNTSIIVLTAHASLETAVEALRQGAHDYLFKPCKTLELRKSVHAGLLKRHREVRQRDLLRQLQQHLANRLEEIEETIGERPTVPSSTTVEPADEDGPLLQWGRLTVDLVRHAIKLNGQLLELSPTEFDLLAYLVSEAPRVVPPQELVRETQGYECRPWEARDMVRYRIYRIRRKVESITGTGDVIRTVRGVGYTLDE